MLLHVLIAMGAGWLQRHQQPVITSLLAEHRVRNAQRGGRRLRLTATERRRRAALAYLLGRTRLKELATLVTPDTRLRWYKRRIAQKVDGSTHRTPLGRPSVAEEVERLAIQMAEEHSTWGSRRMQDALANLGHRIDAITVRTSLRRHPLEPASPPPSRHELGAVPDAALGGACGHRLLHRGGRDVAWLGNVLCPRGDGAGHTAAPERRHPPAAFCSNVPAS